MYKNIHEFEWYRVTCANRLEDLSKSKVERLLVLSLKYVRKVSCGTAAFLEM